jgi:hypothetical protein
MEKRVIKSLNVFALFLMFSFLVPLCLSQCNANKVGADDGAAAGGLFGAGSSKGGMGGGYLTLFGTAHSLNPICSGGIMLELGYVNNIVRKGNDGLAAVTYDHTFNWDRRPEISKRNVFHPFFDIGYTRFFLNGNALHFGGGLLWHYGSSDNGYRLEYRGYSIFGQGTVSTIRLSREWGSNES